MSSDSAIAQAVSGLSQLGFTSMEAEVYVALLRESPMTGYRVASMIGKATANTYKALRSLVEKGAALAEEGDGRLFRAVPPDELMRRFTRAFESQRDDTLDAMRKIGDDDDDLNVYRISHYGQVFERARDMLAQATEVALLVAFPGPLAMLAPDLEAAAARGVDIGVKGYQPIEITGVDFILSTQSDYWLQEIPGDELELVVDGEQYLIALLDGEEVLQAVWTASPFLGVEYHNGVTLEQAITELSRAIQSNAARAELHRLLKLKRPPETTPGARRLKAIKAARRARAKKRKS